MPKLYDVTNRDTWVDPEEAEAFDTIVALKRDLPANTFDRLVKTVDEMIESVDPTDTSKLVWTKAGALFGHGSEGPKKWIEHLWEKVIDVVGPDRLCLIAVGSLLRWRISLRSETWLVYRRESGSKDPMTGKPVLISEYWINEDYVFKGKKKKKGLDVSGLEEKFGRRA
jgi:hypothetical protein